MALQTVSSASVFRFGSAPERRPASFPLGLGASGVHEVCEADFGGFAALTGFALAAARPGRGAVIWIRARTLGLNHGGLLETGLERLCGKQKHFLHVETRRPPDALWATEEAVCSRAASLVVCELTDMDFTASRRLTLASGRAGTPVILLMPHTREGASASAARWRVSPSPSSPNRYDARAPGAPRWQAVLERSRQAPHMAGKSFQLELDDETLSLPVVSGLAPHTAAPRALPPQDRPEIGTAFRKTG
ncbi:MAG: hypothetical protein WA989_00185 [Henriciella sp.]|uniref:ImuA family protein n=1 Tax=Henriciella sp. TaxID=1968823 RepID=UPI003C71F5E6